MSEQQRQAWERQQADLARQVIQHDDAPWLHPAEDGSSWLERLQLVGGLDISFFGSGDDVCTTDGSPAAAASSSAWQPAAVAGSSHASLHREGEDPEHSTHSATHAGKGSSKDLSAGAGDRAVAALAVLSFPALQLQHLELLELELAVPYIPGLLGFREVPAFQELLRRVAAKGVQPQLLLVDGFGLLHPRRCGSASHLGVLTGLPTVGVAKHLLQLEGLLSEKQVRQAAAAAAAAAAVAVAGEAGGDGCPGHRPVRQQEACNKASPSAAARSRQGQPISSASAGWVPLVAAGGEVLGAAVCAAAGAARRPIYVSVGHRLSLEAAVEVVRRCCRHRVPEPIRQADLLSRAAVRHLLQQAAEAEAAAADGADAVATAPGQGCST